MKKIGCVSFFILKLFTIQAQAVKWERGGDFAFLKDQKNFKIEILYDSILLDKEKEKKYIAQIAHEYESEVPGKGEKYTTRWEDAKLRLFPEYFMKDFEGHMKKMHVKANMNVTESKYTLKIYPKNVMTGASGQPFAMGVPCSANFRFVFIETLNPANIVATAVLDEVQGRLIGHDYDETFIGRYKMAFRFAGIILGRDMRARMDNH